MSIMDKLLKNGHKEAGIRDFCIQAARFKKFLENARALLDLFEDGHEKWQGEYIFDRHYVVTFVDSVIERLGMMVYDAGVLVPKSGEALYAIYDKHTLAARNLIGFGAPDSKNGMSGNLSAETDDATDPEYQLLADALRWCNGKDGSASTTVMEFMKLAFFHVIQGLESTDTIMDKRALFDNSGVAIRDMGIYLVDLWKDPMALPKENRSIEDFNNLPLKHLFMDAGPEKTQNGISWVAAVGEYQLSLNALKPDFQFRLETLASGYEQSDFIFIFADKSANLDAILPSGFHVEKTDYGQLAWNLEISTQTIEDSLMIIGRNLFN